MRKIMMVLVCIAGSLLLLTACESPMETSQGNGEQGNGQSTDEAQDKALDDTTAQNETIENIEQLGLAMEELIMNFGDDSVTIQAGFSDINDFINFLKSHNDVMVVAADELSVVDAWGNPIVYNDLPNLGYRFTSYGSDGKPGPAPSREGFCESPEQDLIYSVGQWDQRPKY